MTAPQASPTAISGVSVAETGNTGGESFTATVSDTNGLLSATGAGVSGSGTKTLTITGSLAQVNADLATLSDTDSTAAPDTVHVSVTDSFGNTGSQNIAVTVTAPIPVIAAPASELLGQGQSAAVSGVSLSEAGAVSGETFTVTLADTAGALSATGAGVSGSGTHTLTVTGSLAQVNSDLATLHDVEAAAGSDTIHITATDSLANSATPKDISVTTNGLPVVSAPASISVTQANATGVPGVSVSGGRRHQHRDLHGDGHRHQRPTRRHRRGRQRLGLE